MLTDVQELKLQSKITKLFVWDLYDYPILVHRSATNELSSGRIIRLIAKLVIDFIETQKIRHNQSNLSHCAMFERKQIIQKIEFLQDVGLISYAIEGNSQRFGHEYLIKLNDLLIEVCRKYIRSNIIKLLQHMEHSWNSKIYKGLPEPRHPQSTSAYCS